MLVYQRVSVSALEASPGGEVCETMLFKCTLSPNRFDALKLRIVQLSDDSNA